MPHSRAYAQLANTGVRAKLKISISCLTLLTLMRSLHCSMVGKVQGNAVGDWVWCDG